MRAQKGFKARPSLEAFGGGRHITISWRMRWIYDYVDGLTLTVVRKLL